MNEPMSDEELVRELQDWCRREFTPANYSAQAIQRHAHKKRLTTTVGLALVACTVVATTILSNAWLTHLPRQGSSQREVAVKNTLTVAETIHLLQSIAVRTDDIESRIESLKSRSEQQRQASREFHELHAKILNYKRIAIRNQIALNQDP